MHFSFHREVVRETLVLLTLSLLHGKPIFFGGGGGRLWQNKKEKQREKRRNNRRESMMKKSKRTKRRIPPPLLSCFGLKLRPFYRGCNSIFSQGCPSGIGCCLGFIVILVFVFQCQYYIWTNMCHFDPDFWGVPWAEKVSVLGQISSCLPGNVPKGPFLGENRRNCAGLVPFQNLNQALREAKQKPVSV